MSQGHFPHDYLGAHHDENAKRTRWVMALTAVMMVAEIAAGYITGSMALLADGFHMATDARRSALPLSPIAMPAATSPIPVSASAPARSAILPASRRR